MDAGFGSEYVKRINVPTLADGERKNSYACLNRAALFITEKEQLERR